MKNNQFKSEAKSPTSDWRLKPAFSYRSVIYALLILIIFYVTSNIWTKQVSEIYSKAKEEVAEKETPAWKHATIKIFNSFIKMGKEMFPPQISESTPIEAISEFDPQNLPIFSKLIDKTYKEHELNPDTFKMETTEVKKQILKRPFGYLEKVLAKMLETLEIALWGTVLSVLISLPLAYFCAANYAPKRFLYLAARGIVSLIRAIPELISALFLVVAFGFGPIAGILALAIHSAGFLGKFYAEDIENADKGPQEAIEATGASPFMTLYYSVVPQVFPQYIAYTVYILDRNVRMATVMGFVNAGGIGAELKGRLDQFQYSHVCTILIVIFVTVFALDRLSAHFRNRLI